MIRLIARVFFAIVTFSIGAGIVTIFTANRQTEPVYNVQVPKIPLVAPSPANSPELGNVAQRVDEFFLDYNPKEFSPRGDYFILGKKPKNFREFDVFELAVDEIDGKAYGNALFVTDSNGMHNHHYTVSGRVTKKQLTFIATPVLEEDFEYRFNGHFLKDKWVYTAKKNQAVVKGKLIKLKNGIKIAESEVKFRIEYLGC
jgi:hypothetical protein